MHAHDGTVYRSRDRGNRWKRLKAQMKKYGTMVADEDKHNRQWLRKKWIVILSNRQVINADKYDGKDEQAQLASEAGGLGKLILNKFSYGTGERARNRF